MEPSKATIQVPSRRYSRQSVHLDLKSPKVAPFDSQPVPSHPVDLVATSTCGIDINMTVIFAG